ncbi:uncharacterized protein METZ01_LOCUS154661 [marine metagenome]|jgi:cytochrome c oxidase assembly protein subunit 11|uniref:Cytochrome c oxidase assembly protein CtaG n=1 Tax=marine metagenome TaxID=408172 RepID=A0A382ALF1_9ZZZZ|tara:strand:+ start:674 stop:1222 length:549 start_codon:yes stop_codon:yes gene_type:complete
MNKILGKRHLNNRAIVSGLLTIVVFMALLTYASVPLYNLFCRVTGFGGTPQISSANNSILLGDMISVRLDANTGSGLDWFFYPEENVHDVRIGENNLVNYIVENNSGYIVTGTSVFNITPNQAGKYFNKIECFCFKSTELQPNEIKVMPVSFFIDPEIKNDVFISNLSEITLSYTFYENSDT